MRFEAELVRLEGKLPWTVFYVPFSVKELYGTNGKVFVDTLIDGHFIEGVLLPSKKGHYMVFNADIKKIIPKKEGDLIEVILQNKLEPSPLEIPIVMVNKLKHLQLLHVFEALPRYIQKEEIRKIMSAKKEETIRKRIDQLILTLRSTERKEHD